MPQLLDASFREVRRLHPDGVSLVKTLYPVNSVQFTCPADEAPAMGQWLRVYSPEGDEGLFRIMSVSARYGQDGGTCEVYAEHALCTLNDTFIHSLLEIRDRTVTQVLNTLLGRQKTKYWQLGTCEVPTTDSQKLSWELQRQTVLEALAALLMAYHGKYMLTFDFDTTPWTLNFVRTETAASCECRLSRNLQSAVIQIDRSQMANKLYCPDWKDDSGDTPTPPESVQDDASIAAWGEISAEYNDGSAADNRTVLAHARDYLEQVKEPVIRIQLDAMELAQVTGVPLDRFGIGKKCRIALPQYGYTCDERIMGVTYPDLYEDPGRVVLTLANRIESASTGLARLKQDASGSHGGRGRGGAAAKSQIAETRAIMA